MTDGKLTQQRITTLALVDAINENDMHEFEELCKEVVSEVADG
jgi:hypothetical protein